MWADDLMLMSESHRGLQTCLEKLSSYCSKWGLSINTEKTKTMVFRKGIPRKDESPWYIGNIKLQQVKQYKYLGVIITSDGKFKEAMKDRIVKATKCIYSVRNAISYDGNISTSLANAIFDKQISPIMLYGCPIWALPDVNRYIQVENDKPLDWFVYKQLSALLKEVSGRDIPFHKTYIPVDRVNNKVVVQLLSWADKKDILNIMIRNPDKYSFKVHDYDIALSKHDEMNKVQGKFLKFSLGLSKFASTSATLRELGQYPIYLKALKLSLMYYYRLENEISGRAHTLIRGAFECMKLYKHPWLDSVEYCFVKNGMGNVYGNIKNLEKAYVKRKISLRLQDQFLQENNVKIQGSEHLQTFYNCIKDEDFGRSDYLDKVTSPSMRKLLARIRLNCSKLSPSPYSKINKLCKECNMLLDFKHCILDCSLYKQNSQNFIEQVACKIPWFKQIGPGEMFARIMNLDFGRVSEVDLESLISITLSFIHRTYNHFTSGFWDST